VFTDLDEIVYLNATLKLVCKDFSKAFKDGVPFYMICTFLHPNFPHSFTITKCPSLQKDVYSRMFGDEEKKFDKGPAL